MPLLAGLTELLTGRSIDELSQQWDELKPWQRGVLGLFIVAIAFVAIIAIAMLVITLLV